MSDDKDKEKNKNVRIPTDGGGRHHTWGSTTNRKYKGQHRASDRNPEEDDKK